MSTDRRQNFSALSVGTNGIKSFPSGNIKSAAIGGSAAKKLVIKNLRARPTLPENFQTKSLEKLKRAVLAIQTAHSIDASLEELYQSVEDLCNHGMAERVILTDNSNH
jgi:cullin-4